MKEAGNILSIGPCLHDGFGCDSHHGGLMFPFLRHLMVSGSFCLLMGCSSDASLPDGATGEPDAAVEAAFELGADRGDGATEDGSGTPDQEPQPLWSWCPKESFFQGGAGWEKKLRVNDTALYCGLLDMTRSLAEEKAAKAQLRFVPGEYPLPTIDGEYPFRLPVCVAFRQPDQQPLAQAPGKIRLSRTATTYFLTITQPLQTANHEAWALSFSFAAPIDTLSNPVLLDGRFIPPVGSALNFYFRIQSLDGDVRRFDSCDYNGADEMSYTVTFQGGRADLFLRIGVVGATSFGMFHRASGTLDNKPFAQADYWKLILVPEMHFFVNDFVVELPEPIGKACALKFLDVDAELDPPFGQVLPVDCSGTDLPARTVSEEIFHTPG